MQFVNDLENQIREYLDGDYEISETQDIPSVESVSFKKKVKKMNIVAFSIDMRRSSDLLFKHHKQTSGKIHKAFLTVTAKVIQRNGGRIRSFQGDCILAFWPANYISEITSAVRAGFETKWFLSYKLKTYFDKYTEIDYGIGIDWGEVFILRAGISRNANNNDLIFIGRCVNFATAIANQARAPDHIEISEKTYKNLEDDKIYVSKTNHTNMWRNGKVEWNGENFRTRVTNYYTPLD